MKLLNLAIIGALAVALVAFPVVAGDGDRCEDRGCSSSGTKINPSPSQGGWSIPTKTIVDTLITAINAAKNTSYAINPLIGLLIPSIGIQRSGPITGTVRVIECQDCCGEERRLMVVPVVESRGRVTRRSGPLILPRWVTTTAARGEVILDRESLSGGSDSQDENLDRGKVERTDYNIAAGNTSFSLSFLFGNAELEAFATNRENDLIALADEEQIESARVKVDETELAGITPYCGCVDHSATKEEIEEAVPDLVNTAPLPSFTPTIEISLGGVSRVSGALSAGDPDGDAVWVYFEATTLQSVGLRVDIDQTDGHATFWFDGLLPEDAEALAVAAASRATVYLYDLRPGVRLEPGTKPEEGQYFHKVDTESVNLIFTRSQPPTAKNVKDTMTTVQFREAGCAVTARFEAIDDDPHGEMHGNPISFEIDFSRISPELQLVGKDLYPICGEDGICRASAVFHSSEGSPCLLPTQEISLPIGTYQVGFLVHEHREDGVAIFVHKGIYTLHIVSTPPTAVDDAFDMSTNAAGASQSVVCDVLANDSDIDGDDLLAIKIADGPGHGKAVVVTTEDGRLVITYTSTEGHGGADSFKYQVSDVPEADREDTDWSNVATVTVTTLTPPAVLDIGVMGRPDLDTVTEGYEGPWIMNFEASAPLLLSAVDLDAMSHEGYEFRVSPQPNGAPGVTMASFGGVNTLGRLTCEQLDCAYDEGVQTISMAGTATIKGPQVLLPIAGYLGMRFSVTVIDPDGHVSEPGILTIMISNAPPLGELIRSLLIPLRFGEPMIYALEPAWYEAGCLSFTDPDGDPLRFSLGRPPRKGTVNLLSAGGGGSYSVTMLYEIDRDEALLDHTGEEPFIDTFTVIATDPFGATAETVVEITVDVINSDPVCVDDEVTTPMNTAVEFEVLGNDSDIDGDELTVIAVGVAGNGMASSVAHNMIRYVPNNGFYGDDTFTVSVPNSSGNVA